MPLDVVCAASIAGVIGQGIRQNYSPALARLKINSRKTKNQAPSLERTSKKQVKTPGKGFQHQFTSKNPSYELSESSNLSRATIKTTMVLSHFAREIAII